ncbi:MAG TPA: hypothetical protein DEH78_22365 [Solibacterales bacterium]|nr:hypothetical protein [Bryobacterales bacterium]
MKWIAIALLMAAAPVSAATYYLTVAGLGGEAEYEQRFSGWAKDIDKVLRQSVRDGRVVTLFGADATRERVRAAAADFAREAKPEDAVVLLLIGHGGVDGEYKLILPGPDLTANEMAALLDRIPARRQVVVNMTSASGASALPLRREGRVVVTATKSGTQKNAVVFPRYFAEALRDGSADADKNDAISVLEAFRYADAKTARFYESQKRIATEQALLEDTGKGEGVRVPSPENGQGLVAAQVALLRIGEAQSAARTPEKQRLFARKEELERAIDSLKYQKAAMPYDDYRKQMQGLLMELAKTQEALDK